MTPNPYYSQWDGRVELFESARATPDVGLRESCEGECAETRECTPSPH